MLGLKRLAAAGITGVLMAGIVGTGVATAVVTPRLVEKLTGDWPNDYVQGVRMSADGNVVAYSAAPTIPQSAPGSSGSHVFVSVLDEGIIDQVSVDSNEQGRPMSAWPGGLSTDGRFVTFTGNSEFTGLTTTYLRDRTLGTTEVVSVPVSDPFADSHTGFAEADVSDDGRYVVFSANATNIVTGDTNGKSDVFVRDRQLGVTTRVSVGPAGIEANDESFGVGMSADGSTIIFASNASNLVAGDTNGKRDVFVVDRESLVVERISVSTAEVEGDAASAVCGVTISADGSVVAFGSEATNLVAGDTNFAVDIFVRDRDAGTTIRASLTDSEGQAPVNTHALSPSISNDGTKLAFTHQAQLDPADGNVTPDVYLRDLAAGTTELISRTPVGAAGNDSSGDCINLPGTAIGGAGGGGDVVAFASIATNLTTGADPSVGDVFVSRPAPEDSDGDGIADVVDTNDTVVSTAFNDGDGTAGAVTTKPAGFTVKITDAIGANKGVQVTVIGSGSNRVAITMQCQPKPYTVKLAAGSNTVLTCASIIVDVSAGSPAAEVTVGDDLAVISIPGGASAEVDIALDDTFTIGNVSGGTVTVTVDGQTAEVDPGETFDGAAWDFQGFLSPVDNPDTFNTAKAGRSLPIRWRIVDANGLAVTTLTSASLTVQSLACPLGVTADQVEEYTTGSSGLVHEGGGFYHMNWQTPTSYQGSCKTLRLDIGDGVIHTALFRFTK